MSDTTTSATAYYIIWCGHCPARFTSSAEFEVHYERAHQWDPDPMPPCREGVEQVLDPNKVLVGIFTEADSLQETYYLKADVADVLAVLDGENT